MTSEQDRKQEHEEAKCTLMQINLLDVLRWFDINDDRQFLDLLAAAAQTKVAEHNWEQARIISSVAEAYETCHKYYDSNADDIIDDELPTAEEPKEQKPEPLSYRIDGFRISYLPGQIKLESVQIVLLAIIVNRLREGEEMTSTTSKRALCRLAESMPELKPPEWTYAAIEFHLLANWFCRLGLLNRKPRHCKTWIRTDKEITQINKDEGVFRETGIKLCFG